MRLTLAFSAMVFGIEGTFQGNDAVPAELISLTKEYYELIGGGPSEKEIVERYKTGSAVFVTATQGPIFFDMWSSKIMNGLRHIVNSAHTEHRLDSLLYEPFHWLMRSLRIRYRNVGFLMAAFIPTVVELHSKTKAQVGFYLYFTGLEEFIGAVYPSSSLKEKRTRTIEFIESDITPIVQRKGSVKVYRTYTDLDLTQFTSDVLTIETMISQGLGGRSESNRSTAIELFKLFEVTKDQFWAQRTRATVSEVRGVAAQEISVIATRIKNELNSDDNST